MDGDLTWAGEHSVQHQQTVSVLHQVGNIPGTVVCEACAAWLGSAIVL